MRRILVAVLAAALLFPSTATAQTGASTSAFGTNHNEETVVQLQAEMASGKLTSVQLTQYYIDRILALDQNGPNVNSVIELNPDALSMAQNADALRAKGKVLGPLHGIPILLKDNIDTGDKMQTTAGSIALLGRPAVHDSTVAGKLRAGGAVILGKTNLSEWANFRSFFSTSGWSGTGRSRPALPADYTAFVDPNGLRGARVGVTRQGIDNAPPQVIAAFDNAVAAMQSAGATIIDLDGSNFQFASGDGEFVVLLYDFKIDVQKYFATRVGVPMAKKTLADLIAFDDAKASTEMPYFFQEIFDVANLFSTDPNAPQPLFGISYNQALAIDHDSGANGIDAALSQFNLDAVVAPTDSPGWTTDLILSDHFLFASSGLAGPAGYPIVQVPAGNVLGMPIGISFLGTAFSEATLIRLASAFEAATHARFQPTF